jgi:hypothetical protein
MLNGFEAAKSAIPFWNTFRTQSHIDLDQGLPLQEMFAMDRGIFVYEISTNDLGQWVLIGDPQHKKEELVAGIVIGHAKEKCGLLDCGINWRDHFETATTFFTGERPKNKRFLL